ncbi:HEAT repeat-containing protein 1 homolog [Drosophila grimshawi]|uniref:HEAT repeat-containing protein 1 n=1 Tax=Drosophila grimshawi TaxID=7222 RepID=B4JQK9_DROGR|nr:HEAT repeat-containing protein 1 homolog [Drosophila grimshawi]EDV99189.1 GH13718 [Drosophila grimshawi]
MTTSLAQQLQNLAAPQTSVPLTDARSRASILFDPKEAATKDRRAIYEIGLSGLLELTAFNPNFKEFQLTLFDEATLTLERAVEQAEVNQLLDAAIAKFLRLLSPYFLLRPAHMCFEWLLRRFQVHDYNREQVMALIMPYHETNTFVQVLQTMRLRKSDEDWFWLRRLQRPGVPLSKTTIVNRAASVPSFLSFVCRSTRQAVKELGPRAPQLQAQINFYATVVVGALQTAKPLEDWHISTILESLLKGLVSDTVDFVAASYVIVAQLVSRTKLKTKICNALLERVANCTFERLHTTALMLLIAIQDKQQAARPQFTPKTMLNLACQKWLINALTALANDNIAIRAICMPLVRGAVAAIREGDESTATHQQFLDNLLANVPLSQNGAQQLINCFLDTFVDMDDDNESMRMDTTLPENDDENTIIIDSDDEMLPAKTNFQTWYTEFLEKLERRYPDAFDLSVKAALSAKSKTSNRKKALKLALGFRLNTTDEKAKRVYEKLYHYSADWRLSAVQQLLQNLNVPRRRERCFRLLQECLPDRIKDDSPAVVAALLTLPTVDFVQMLGARSFAQTLCELLQRAQQQRQTQWDSVVPQAVQHLTTSAVSDDFDSNLLLLALMPYLFPSNALSLKEHEALLLLLSSNLASKLPFLGELNVCTEHEKFNVSQHRQQFLNVIATAGQLANQQMALLDSLEQHGGIAYLRGEATQLTHLLILLTAYTKRELSASESLQMLQRLGVYTSGFHFRLTKDGGSNHGHSRNNNDNFVPLQLYVDFLTTLAKNTKFPQLSATHWNQMTDELHLCLLLLDVLCAHVYDKHCAPAERREWTRALKDCVNLMLPEAQQKLDFLCNFYVYETLPELFSSASDYAVFRVRGFQLLQALLRAPTGGDINCSLLHVLRIANACNSPLQTLRQQALQTLQLLDQKKLDAHIAQLVECLLQRQSELCMDHEQYALILHTILQNRKCTPREKLLLAKLRRSLLDLVCDVQQPAICTAALLKALKHMNNEAMLTALLPLAESALKQVAQIDPGNDIPQLAQLSWPHSDIYCAVIERFEGSVGLSVLQSKPSSWQLLEVTFKQHTTYVQLEQKLQPLPCVLLNSVSPETYEQLQSQHKVALLQLIVEAATAADNDSIFLAAHRLLKRCSIDCQSLIPMLASMLSRSTRSTLPERRVRGATETKLDLTSIAWKQGMTLLELLEHKKQLVGAELLIPQLFDLLQLCLTLEEHSAAEYPKQLILSSLLHCCEAAQAAGVQLSKVLPESCFRIEQVVQCLRNTQNPQTQQHALLFLTRCAALYPQQVLHKIVEIFTFVGSTVARHDDAFSLHIIRNVVETIIPTLLLQPGEQRQRLVIAVLKVFADICIDVPLHRRLPLYETLFRVLNPRQHLWQFLCIVLESQMQLAQTPHTAGKQVDRQRLEFARELTLMFEQPAVIVDTCVHLLDYLATLPQTKEALAQAASSSSASSISPEQQLFDVRTRSFKQLRHYKYLIMDYLSSVSSSAEFQTKLGKPKQSQLALYQHFIAKTLSYVVVVNQAHQLADNVLKKYWHVLGNHAHDVLDNAIGLLRAEHFLNVITELLQHELIHVRIKVLELLVTKLTPPSDYFAQCHSTHFGLLFEPLCTIVDGILDTAGGNNAQQAQLQQTALHALQLLAKRHGPDYLDECRTLLAKLTRIVKRRANVPKGVVGNVVLTLVEVCASIKAHALAQLPKFAPQLTELLKEQVQLLLTQRQTPDYVCSALVTALHKLFLTLPLFLGPYLVDIIGALIRLSVQLENAQLAQDKRTQALKLRIVDVWTAVAQGVEARILVPSCAKSYECLLEAKAYDELGMLMRQLLLPCIQHNANSELQPVQETLSELFLQALEFRLQVRGHKQQPQRQRIAEIEASVSEAFVAWILKLSETSFRPMYSRVHMWAMERTEIQPKLTYFLLTNRIAEALKSLFVLFADEFIEDAARLLHEHNTSHPEFSDEVDSDDIVDLLSAILSTLRHVFLHCDSDFINDHRFNTLMRPLVDQLENSLVLASECETLQQTLSDCIAQLAAASNDVLWKQLNNQVLLKTRNFAPEVRILAFNSSVAIARKLGESFAPLLPETVPFIAELLEDEHERVEKNTRSAVQELETILGEPVQKYL